VAATFFMENLRGAGAHILAQRQQGSAP
jgi:hypothetical protein